MGQEQIQAGTYPLLVLRGHSLEQNPQGGAPFLSDQEGACFKDA